MKRIISFVLCAAMLLSCFVFVANADETVDSAVQNVVEMIFDLNENSTNEQLVEAIEAYEALTAEQKADVYNYDRIVSICNQKAAAIVSQIDKLPEVEHTDIYHHESAVRAALSAYNVLVDESKELVTNYEKLEAIADRLDALHEWNDNKAVNLLNSTLAAMDKYTQEDIDKFADTPATGLYYYFEEVDILERGDPTTGYYQLEEEAVKDQRYVRIDMEMKFTDVDVINGWPILFKLTTEDAQNGYGGYDFLNRRYWYGTLSHISHGYIETVTASENAEIAFGVWNHFTYIYDNKDFTILCNGEKVFETTTPGVVDYVIAYPWLCNLEMTNVIYTDRNGKETLSPFRNLLNNPTGWSRKTNDKGTTMLDYVKESVGEARDAYEALTDEQKEQVVGIEALDKVEAMIDRVGKNEVVVTDGTADVQFAAEGDAVTVTAAEPEEGKAFDKWEVVSGEITLDDATKTTATFTMPATKVELKATYKDAVKLGDVNGDDNIDAKDILAIMKHLLNKTPDKFIEAAADFNGDKNIDAKDILAIMKYMLNAK